MRQYLPDRLPPSYAEFENAIIRKYESSDIRNKHLHACIQSIYLGPYNLSNIQEYTTRFHSIELQIHNMAFKDCFYFFMKLLPNDLTLYLKDQCFKDMENIYKVAQ